jgi:hypothetical protein
VFTLLGAALLKVSVFDVWELARQNAGPVHLLAKDVFSGGFAMIVGIYLLILGEAGYRLITKDPATGRMRPKGWIAILLLSSAPVVLYFLLRLMTK